MMFIVKKESVFGVTREDETKALQIPARADEFCGRLFRANKSDGREQQSRQRADDEGSSHRGFHRAIVLIARQQQHQAEAAEQPDDITQQSQSERECDAFDG